MNVPLLQEVRDFILEEPQRFDMATWAGEDSESPCGTTLCIAGAALTIKSGARLPAVLKALIKGRGVHALWDLWGTYSGSNSVIENAASRVLDLTPSQSSALFYDFQWPQPWRKLYASAEGNAPLRAAIGAARIQHFITTGE